jgi:hypothetical protein
MLENTRDWNKQKKLAKSKGYQVLVTVDTCISVTVDVKLQILEYIHENMCESMIICGIVVWGLKEACKELDTYHSRFCKKLMCILNCAANGFAEMELDRESRRGKCKGHVI